MTTTKTRTEKVEGLVLVAILLLVAIAAGAASFTHVHDWTMENTPDGTPDWFGWANAVISELVPVAALLTIRRRRRINGPIGYPLALLIGAAGLSLSAQLAVAKPGPSGWLLSAVPALAFMALVKLVLAPAHTPTPPDVTTEETPDATEETAALIEETPATIDRHPTEDIPARLVSAARMVTVQHRQTSTEPITNDELAARLNTSPAIAGQLLALIDNPAPARINGHTPVLGGAR
jgi:hypothetical protein